MFLNESFEVKIKERGCQETTVTIHIKKRNMFNYSLFRGHDAIMCKDTKENEYIVIMDIPGAFLYIDMNHNVQMLLEDSTAKLVCNPRHDQIQKIYLI